MQEMATLTKLTARSAAYLTPKQNEKGCVRNNNIKSSKQQFLYQYSRLIQLTTL